MSWFLFQERCIRVIVPGVIQYGISFCSAQTMLFQAGAVVHVVVSAMCDYTAF
jgi:xanthine dehydrogenase molybdopterin-binding subunit B